MRIIISLVLAVCLMIGGTIAAVACEYDPYDFPFYADTYGDTYDLPLYSATYAAEPDVDWVPNKLIRLNTNLPEVPALLVFQR
jgi:hypothetical protein